MDTKFSHHIETMTGSSILVTGAHGFLGRNVARSFASSGNEVSGIGHGLWAYGEMKQYGLASWLRADITLDSLVAHGVRPDVIVHCAGSGSVASSISHPSEDYARTVTSTLAVLEYLRMYSPHTTFIYPSSAAVYGVTERLPIKESYPLKPASPYGTHKLMAELLCRSYAANYGIAIVIVRFFSIYGEGLRKQLLWDACSKIVAGESSFFGTGAELRDWLHVEDAARLVQKAIGHASPAAPIINGGSGTGVAVSEILCEIFRSFNVDKQPSFNGTARLGDPPGYEADMTIAAAWGWSPQIQWREGLRRYIDWFKGDLQ